MKVIGIDLSGPSNLKDTAIVLFSVKNNELLFEKMETNVSDQQIETFVQQALINDDVFIGIDAPLSYQDGGGDRPGDKYLRQYIKSRGMSHSSVMPPTLTRMVYLTLRGISLTRRLQRLQRKHCLSIVEVHPGAALGARIEGEQVRHVLQYKNSLSSRQFLVDWLSTQGLQHIPECITSSSHQIDACGAALAAWHWSSEDFEPKWIQKSTPPEHPFDYCC